MIDWLYELPIRSLAIWVAVIFVGYCWLGGTLLRPILVARFKAEHGEDRVISDPMEAAYAQVYLWKLAVEKAGSFEVDRVREAFAGGIEFDAPGGKIMIDPQTHHTYKPFLIGRIRHDRQFDIVYETPKWIKPEPYPALAFPGWQCDWTQGGVTAGAEVVIKSV